VIIALTATFLRQDKQAILRRLINWKQRFTAGERKFTAKTKIEGGQWKERLD